MWLFLFKFISHVFWLLFKKFAKLSLFFLIFQLNKLLLFDTFFFIHFIFWFQCLQSTACRPVVDTCDLSDHWSEGWGDKLSGVSDRFGGCICFWCLECCQILPYFNFLPPKSAEKLAWRGERAALPFLQLFCWQKIFTSAKNTIFRPF